MNPADHPEFEHLSAYYDGEAPEWDAHVQGCAACRARVDQIAAVATAVRGPVPTPSGPSRDEAIGRALAAGRGDGEAAGGVDAVAGGGSGGGAGAGAGRRLRWVAGGSVAAALVAVVGAVALLRGGDGGPTADRALDQGVPSSQAEGQRSFSGAPPAPPGDIDHAVMAGDIGEVPDARALADKVEPAFSAAGVPKAGGPSEAAAPATTPAGARVVGTRPCEIEARERDQGLAQVVYVATGRRQGSALVILGFSRRDGGPVTVYAMAQDGCRLLLSTPL